MIKYNYQWNEETKKVERSIAETYPDLDILERGVKVGRPTQTILKGLRKAYEGQAELPIVKIEEQWYEAQSKIQELEDELEELQTKLSDPDITEEQKNDVIKREKEILGYDEDDGTYIEGELEKAERQRELIEEGDGTDMHPPHKWLKAYRGVKVDETRPTPEAVKIPKDIIKRLIAHERDLQVRNLEDSVADLAKEIALVMSFVETIYSALSDAEKDSIPTEKRQILEYGIAKFKETRTRADMQFATEGVKLIDKVLEREQKIADIIEELKNEAE